MKNKEDVKNFIKEQLSGITLDDSKEFQIKVISSIYNYLGLMGHELEDIKLLINEIIVEKLKILKEKLKKLNDKY